MFAQVQRNSLRNIGKMVAKENIEKALQEVMDPELMIDIFTLELIYDIQIEKDKVKILMTFTTPLCPYGPQLKEDVKNRLMDVDGVNDVEIEVTFNPRWKPSEDLRAMLGV